MEIKDIIDREEKCKRILTEKICTDKRLEVSCPEFKYPEPLYLYAKSKKTGKSIAVRIDGHDKTVRFWDYADDDYSDENGVWNNITESGIEKFVKKLFCVMEKAIDVEFYDASAEFLDCFSCVPETDPCEDVAKKAAKKFGKGIDFAIAKVSSFFGDKIFIFDKNYNVIKSVKE